jgi:hypothetical protein
MLQKFNTILKSVHHESDSINNLQSQSKQLLSMEVKTLGIFMGELGNIRQ